VGEEKEPELGLLPVSVAAGIAYGSLVSSEKAARNPAELDEHLNLVAKALCAVVSVFSVTLNGQPVILSPEEVARGKFLDAAQVLHLGTDVVTGPRLRASDLFLAIELLRHRPPLAAS
jgi:hypothetical protein